MTSWSTLREWIFRMTVPAQCQFCKRLTRNETCEAYPEGIPLPILLGEHNHEVLCGELGVSLEGLTLLAESGVI